MTPDMKILLTVGAVVAAGALGSIAGSIASAPLEEERNAPVVSAEVSARRTDDVVRSELIVAHRRATSGADWGATR